MALICLKGDIDFDLLKIGLKSGDEINAFPEKGNSVGRMSFEVKYNQVTLDCVVYPENYDIIK